MITIKKRTLYSLMWATILCVACVENDKDYSDPDSSQENTLDLDIPSDFTWNTSRSVNLEVTAPVTSIVSIYTEAECSDKSLVAELPVGPENVIEGSVDVPTSIDYLYVKYPTGESTTAISKVKIQQKATAIRATDDNQGYLSIGTDQLLGMAAITIGSDEHQLRKYITSGNVIFEDSWPDFADYDFNDLVADYKITSYTANNERQYPYERIEVSVTIRAIGGSAPDKLGLRFLGDESGSLLQRHIGKYTGLDKSVNGLTARLANPNQPDSAPIFYIEGLKQLKKNGSIYYNTEQQDDKNLTTINFGIYANEVGGSQESNKRFVQASNAYNQDFFLVTYSKREIHLRGYEATPLYSSYAVDAAKSKDAVMSPDKTYSTDKNFVWGMKVVSDFHFPLEKVDIRQAYAPNFAKWVESNGTQLDNWFKYVWENPGTKASW